MSAVTLLGVVRAICEEMGLPVPSTASGSTQKQVVQLVAYANQAGDALRDEADWPALRKTATITTISGTSGYTVNLVAGADTFTCSRIISETGWDSTNSWYFAGAVNDQEWAALQYGLGTTPLRKMWRTTSDSTIEVFPTPDSSGEFLTVSFICNQWAQSNAGAALTTLSSDNDVHLFNDRLFILGAKWRFLQMKGLPFGAEFAEYKQILGVRKSAARPARSLSLDTRSARRHFIGWANVPDTGYGP